MEKTNSESEEVDKIGLAKDLLSSGSRNYLLKKYDLAAEELSQVCSIYEELNGPLCEELGVPYLMYAKCLISLAINENNVLDVADKEEQSDDEDEVEDSNAVPPSNNEKGSSSHLEKENPGTSSGETGEINGAEEVAEPEDEETDPPDLQLAWETLELAAKIFSKQGLKGLPNLAEVYTELGNIELENNISENAREDYEKALQIYDNLPYSEHRRAIAAIHYKIGLTFILQDNAKEGIPAFRTAADILDNEINEINKKTNFSVKDDKTVQEIKETQQEIIEKINEIEENTEECTRKIKNALKKCISIENIEVEKTIAPPTIDKSPDAPVNKPSGATDISHLIKRKKDTDMQDAVQSKKPAL